MARGQVVEGQYLKIYKSLNAVLGQIGGMVFFIWLIQWFKGWLFGWLYGLTGWSFLDQLAKGVWLVGFCLVLLVIWSIYLFFKWRSTYYEIYPDRVVIRKGIIARRRDEIQMDQFGALSIEQGMMGRMLNYGNLRFATGSMGAVGRTLRQIPNPEYYLQLINSMLNRVPKPKVPAIETLTEQGVEVNTSQGMPVQGEVKIGGSG